MNEILVKCFAIQQEEFKKIGRNRFNTFLQDEIQYWNHILLIENYL